MKKVLLIDSGSGGVNVLKECVKECPCCDFLLYCDSANLPYGNKEKDELLKIAVENLEKIYAFFKFEIVIFACNTLTAVCLEECRKKFEGVEFVGTVPAIKPALQEFEKEEVLVLATQNTKKFNKSLNKHKDLKVLCIDNLAQSIDENLDCLEGLKPLLEENLNGLRGKFKSVVLGCTHYVAVEDLIGQILGEVKFFDSANGVARRLRVIIEEIEENSLQTNENGVVLPNYQIQIMTSGSNELRNKFLWWLNRE